MAAQTYEIRIRGHLASEWAAWLEALQMRCLDNGETLLWGALADQAALVGVLNRLNALNLPILSVNKVDARAGQGPDEITTNHSACRSESEESE